MKSYRIRILCWMLSLLIGLGGVASAAAPERESVDGVIADTDAPERESVDAIIADTAAHLLEMLPAPQVGSIGGEWAVLGLARSGYSVPQAYFQQYYRTAEAYIKACGGVLHDKKYTEYARLALALTAIGKDPRDVAGHNLLAPLGDYEATIAQGINGAVWALIALDCGDYEIPQCPDAAIQATRELYLNRILLSQLSDGGWALNGDVSDPDITGMALAALAKYQERADVRQAVEEALACMSLRQEENGAFSGWESRNAESIAQMLVALCELGLAPDDTRFVKNGKTLIDALMQYYVPGEGFRHTAADETVNQMATEQALYALAAVRRQSSGAPSLYRMTDAQPLAMSGGAAGLPNRHSDVRASAMLTPGKTFADIVGHEAQEAIEALAARGIIQGMTEDSFAPNQTMTRAEFAAIVVRGLGLPQGGGNLGFLDVTEADWFCAVVAAAYHYGIVSGVSKTEFLPNSTITREEAAVMVARAAGLCGLDTAQDAMAVRDILAGFSDYIQASDWARPALAFCYDKGILADDVMEILPQQPICRAEIAQMLARLLSAASLL